MFWVRTIALRKAIDHLRQRKRLAVLNAQDDLEPDADVDAAAPIDLEDMMSLEEALASLSDPERVLVVMLYVERYTCGEIARDLGIPENTVKSQARRALAKLRRQLQDTDDFDAQIERFRP